MHVKQSVATIVRRMLLEVVVLVLLVAFMTSHAGTASAWIKMSAVRHGDHELKRVGHFSI